MIAAMPGFGVAIETAVAALPAGSPACTALAEAIERGLAEARATWPAGPEPGAKLGAYIAARVDAEAPPPNVTDLYLAWWAQRDARGAAAFEARYAPDLDRVLQRFHRLDGDELRQLLRVKLFVNPGKLAEYTGRGALISWLRVVAARTFVDAARAAARDPKAIVDDPDGPLLAVADGGFDVARQIDREVLRTAIREAFAAAVAALGDRQRTFLRLVTNHGMTLDQVAEAYRVGRATVARDLARARASLREHTRHHLQDRLELTSTDLDSLIRGLDSKLELSLGRVLGEPSRDA